MSVETEIKKSLSVHSGSDNSICKQSVIDIIPHFKAYIDKGLYVFPCKARGKKPAIKTWKENASKDPAVIKAWCKRTAANIGLPTGTKNNIWVLDIDQKSGGLETLEALEAEHGKFNTFTVKTGGGGYHFYFLHHAGIKNSANILSGVDIRGEGGYVIAAGSVHENGTAYEIINDIDPVQAPEWLLKLIEEKKQQPAKKAAGKTTDYGRGVLLNQFDAVINAAVGNRNSTLNVAAFVVGQYIASGEIEENEGVSTLETAGTEAGLDAEEIKKTIKSGIDGGKKKDAAEKKEKAVKIAGSIDNKYWKTADYIDFFAGVNYHFKRNLLDDTVESNGKPFADFEISELKNKTADKLIKRVPGERFHDIYMGAAAANAYHPIQEYFKRLPKGSGSSILKLSEYFTTNDDDLFKAYLTQWFCGAVAKAFTGEQNAALVLDGVQGIGKSQFVKWLCPLKKFFHEGAIQPDSKDSLMNLIKYFIWEVPELGATTRKQDREALKDFFSKVRVNVRAPYAITNMEKQALSSFIGTINNEAGFLNDPTGTRRFNVITLDSINWNYSKEIDINDIWSEAYQIYKSDFDYHLTPEEVKKHNELNGEYTYKNHIDELLDEHINFSDEPDDFISTLELVRSLKNLQCTGTDDSISKKVKAWMQRNGLGKAKQKKINGKKLRGFSGVYPHFPEHL